MEATARVLNTSTDYNGVEKRAEHRRRVLKGGTLHFNKGYSSLECIIRDLSSNGARVQMGETFGVPSRFTISISGEDTRIEAAIRWRNSRYIGLSLLLRSH